MGKCSRSVCARVCDAVQAAALQVAGLSDGRYVCSLYALSPTAGPSSRVLTPNFRGAISLVGPAAKEDTRRSALLPLTFSRCTRTPYKTAHNRRCVLVKKQGVPTAVREECAECARREKLGG